MKLLLRLLINAGAVLAIAYFIEGIEVSGFYAALITVVVFGVINAIIGTILKVLTLPINILTLGLFSLVINALLLWFTGSILEGFEVAGFVPALFAAFFLWVTSWLTNWLLSE